MRFATNTLTNAQQLAVIRHENEHVMRGITAGLSREEISRRHEISLFRVALAERRLVRLSLLEEV